MPTPDHVCSTIASVHSSSRRPSLMSKRAGEERSKTALTSTFSHPPPDATGRVRRATQRASPGCSTNRSKFPSAPTACHTKRRQSDLPSARMRPLGERLDPEPWASCSTSSCSPTSIEPTGENHRSRALHPRAGVALLRGLGPTLRNGASGAKPSDGRRAAVEPRGIRPSQDCRACLPASLCVQALQRAADQEAHEHRHHYPRAQDHENRSHP